jgi:phosphonate transport system permease protein
MTVHAPSVTVAKPALRDPAWLRRLLWTGVAIVLLWPALVSTEFRPWIFFEANNLKITGRF